MGALWAFIMLGAPLLLHMDAVSQSRGGKEFENVYIEYFDHD